MTSQEDLAAENVLKRAELARISRQLKSRLSKTNLKIKDRSSPSGKTLSSSPIKKQNNSKQVGQHPADFDLAGVRDRNIMTTPTSTSRSVRKKKSYESMDSNRTEDEYEENDSDDNNERRHSNKSKYKRTIRQPLPPSSPVYEEFAIPVNPPSTPSQQKIHINPDIYNTGSTNKTFIQNSSSPALHSSAQHQKQLLSTPDQKHHDEGADLLMFLATSPSPVQYKQPPSTPSRLISSKFNQSSSIQRSSTNTNGNGLHLNATPGTPMRNLLKTPGFNMNDYVNLFTPSPGHIARSPEQFSKDVNGKLIKF
jgi:curved DNA-binding protein CbpA